MNCYNPPSDTETDRTSMPVSEKLLKFRALGWFSKIIQLRRGKRELELGLLHLIHCFSQLAR